uniref:Uncharacterized protein n=1 Tax=Parascaris equorum TaxID=6256 RepID=A0A914RM81_PAREQ
LVTFSLFEKYLPLLEVLSDAHVKYNNNPSSDLSTAWSQTCSTDSQLYNIVEFGHPCKLL